MPKGSIDTAKSYSGAEKAAILLLSINQTQASKILKDFNESEIQRLTNYGSRLSRVPNFVIREIKQEFCMELESNNPLAIGQSKDQLKALLSSVLSEDRLKEVSDLLEKDMEVGDGLESLKWLDAQTIANFLRNEHPQTVALILAHLEAPHAAEVLHMIPARVQPDVIKRMATLERISPTIINDVSEVIKAELISSANTSSSFVGGVQAVAEILNHIDKTSENSIFEKLNESDQALSEQIRNLMFAFDDLRSVDDRSLQMVMREVSNEMLTLALRTASEELKGKMLGNVSSRAGQMIREELEAMGPVKLSDVEKAQLDIVNIARRLETEGKIALGGGGGETFV